MAQPASLKLHVLPRLCVALAILYAEVLVVLLAVSWFDVKSLTAQAIEATGHAGWVLVLLSAGCCFTGLTEVIVNDFLPAQFHMRALKAIRHIGLGVISISLAALSVIVTFRHGFLFLVSAYWLNSFIAGGLMIMDVFFRFREE